MVIYDIKGKVVRPVMKGEKIMDKEKSEGIRGKGVMFSRVRRITGYLVGDLKYWGTGKRAEEHDRVKHTNKED